jgi:hypothetical protein
MRSSIRSFAMLFMLAFVFACATTQQGPRTEPNGNVPLVQIQNDTYAEAVIFLNGTRFATVQGSHSTLLPIVPTRIPADGQIQFTARIATLDQTIVLPVVEYQVGRKIRITLRPESGSTAF